MSEYIRPIDFKSGWTIDGYVLLSEVGQYDLMRIDTRQPAGRLSEWPEEIGHPSGCPVPEGTQWIDNRRCNKWWVRDSSGRIILGCFDMLTPRNRITIP